MSEFNLVEDFDYAITSVRDTDWHWIDDDDGEDIRVGVDYNDIKCAVNECASKWQLSHDKLTEQVKMLRDALDLADTWLRIDGQYYGSPVCGEITNTLEATK